IAQDDMPRIAELLQRTNQFNLTTIRRRAGEVAELLKSARTHGVAVRVRDRFGDYGLVGALLCRFGLSALEVDTFVLSCRALGRGVEHRVVNELARIAREEGLSTLTFLYRRTTRNAPAWNFLQR